VDAYGVPRLEGGHVAQLAPLDALDDRAHRKGSAREPRADDSETAPFANGS
jgi:hypothetical protein